MASFNFSGGAGVGSAPASNYSPAYGGIPNVPDPTQSAGQAITGNAGNLGSLTSLLGGIDTSQQNQLLNQYNMAIPNYSGLTQTASTVAGQNLAGKLPQDVINEIAQQGAERGVATGNPGSANSNAAYLRALGLDTLAQQQTGFQQLGQLTSTAPVAPLFNPASFLVTADQEQQANAARDLYQSAPIPAAAAAAAMSAASIPSGMPWWAHGAGFAGYLGPGTTQVGNTYHTPYAGF